MLKAYSIMYCMILILLILFLFLIQYFKAVEIDWRGYIVITYCALTTITLLLHLRYLANTLLKYVNTALVSIGAAAAIYIFIEMLIRNNFIPAIFIIVLLFLLLCTALIRVLLKN
jgi:hypothetical protein